MKKVFLAMFLLVLVLGCKPKAAIEQPEETEQPTLSELQIVACDTADGAGTCNSRLVDVGIIMPAECCEKLGKCC